MSKQIKLTKNQYAIVDDSDFEYINQWKWCVVGTPGKYYAFRMLRKSERVDGVSNFLYMHRALASTPIDMDTDHTNGNGLDNRRSNLRVCTTAQNLANRTKLNTNKTGFKGVHFDKKRNKFVAQLGKQRNGVRSNLVIGFYSTAKEASVAYEAKAVERYGEFARLEVSH